MHKNNPKRAGICAKPGRGTENKAKQRAAVPLPAPSANTYFRAEINREPYSGLLLCHLSPTAYAVGCILAPLRGWNLELPNLGSRVRGTIRIRRVVIAPVLIFMGEVEIGFGQAECSEEGIAGSHGNFPLHRLQGIGRN